MKKLTTLLGIFTLWALHVTCALGQTVSVFDMSYIDGTPIPLGGPITIEANGEARIQFAVQLQQSSGQAGTLTVYTKRYADDVAVQHGPSETIFSGMNFFSSSRDITLSGNNFFATGGRLYAEFMTTGGIAYRSGNYTISVPGGGSGGNGGNDPEDPPITYNQIEPAQFLYSGENPILIQGTTPMGGDGSYSYSWMKHEGGGWNFIPNANGKNYQPPAGTTVTRFRRRVTSGTRASLSNEHKILHVTNDENMIYVDDNDINIGESITLEGSQLSSYRDINWSKSTDNVSWSHNNSLCRFTPFSCTQTLNQTTFYRRHVTYWDGTGNYSNVIVVYTRIANDHIMYDSQSCTIIGSIPTGGYGSGSFTYKWYQRPVNGNWALISGATAKDYTPPTCSPSSTLEYRRVTITDIPNAPTNNTKGNLNTSVSNYVAVHGFYKESRAINELNVSLSPNPSKGRIISITVEGLEKAKQEMEVTVYSLSGLELQKKYLTLEKTKKQNEIQLNSLSSGIYIMTFKIGDQILNRQLILE